MGSDIPKKSLRCHKTKKKTLYLQHSKEYEQPCIILLWPLRDPKNVLTKTSYFSSYIISKSTFFTDQLQPEVIQRRSSITAPMSPRSSTTTTIITIIYSTIVTTTNSPSRSYYFICIFPKMIQFRDPVHLLREEIEALNKVET